MFLFIILVLNTYAQSLQINGVISTFIAPVRYASVTFIDGSDTTNKFSTITDQAGNYQINIITALQPGKKQTMHFDLGQNYPNTFKLQFFVQHLPSKSFR